MGTDMATACMPTDKDQSPKGRPGRRKGAGRITTRFSMVATPEYLDWLTRLAVHMGRAEASDVVRDSLRATAEKVGFEMPPLR